MLTARKRDSQDEMIKGQLESVIEGYIFPNNISRLQQQTHNRKNPLFKKPIVKFSLFPDKKLHILITCTNVNVIMNVYNEKILMI